LYSTETEALYEIGRFKTPKHLDNELRVDLHPRFNHTRDKILIDSAIDGNRGMYIIDVSKITKN